MKTWLKQITYILHQFCKQLYILTLAFSEGCSFPGVWQPIKRDKSNFTMQDPSVRRNPGKDLFFAKNPLWGSESLEKKLKQSYNCMIQVCLVLKIILKTFGFSHLWSKVSKCPLVGLLRLCLQWGRGNIWPHNEVLPVHCVNEEGILETGSQRNTRYVTRSEFISCSVFIRWKWVCNGEKITWSNTGNEEIRFLFL